ncbi:MAG: hypothetical protein GX339_06930 [Tissierellia bacterium]|nr:hypothetical protein [Tissierellia bacterium]
MLRRNIIPITILLLILLFIMKPNMVSEGVFQGVNIWAYNIVPYLLPMSILSNILLQYNFLYRLSDRLSFISSRIFNSKYALIPYFISFVAGYPSGAMTVNSMASYKRINDREANSLVTFTNNCSFQFIAGAVAFSMLGNMNLSLYIAVPHLLSAILIGILMKKEIYNPYKVIINQKSLSFYKAFNSSIYKAVTSILSVGGVIVIFSVLSNFFINSLTITEKFFSLNPGLNHIIHSMTVGILEVTNGCSAVALSDLPLQVKLIIINFLISFSGLSIVFQTMAVINDFHLEVKNYIFYKFIQAIISVVICILMLIIFEL